jgi:hypothetical protein
MPYRVTCYVWLAALLVGGGSSPLVGQTSGETPPAPVPAPLQTPVHRPPLLRRGEAVEIATVLGLTMFVDGAIREDVQERRAPLTNHIARLGNSVGDPRYLAPVLGAGWLIGEITGQRRLERAVVHAGEAAVVAAAVSEVVKLGVGRVRPLDGADPDRFRPLSGNGSFPSGHTTVAFAVASALAHETHHRWLDVALYGLASATALSRLNDNSHWMSDVMAGGIVGYLVGRQVVPGSTGSAPAGAHLLAGPHWFGIAAAF